MSTGSDDTLVATSAAAASASRRSRSRSAAGVSVHERGQVIGVTTWGYLLAEGLNFAVPVSTVKTFLENREAFAYDKDNPNTGRRYLRPPRKGRVSPP